MNTVSVEIHGVRLAVRAQELRAEMDVEERTKMAITYTRKLLENIFDDPGAIAFMAANELKPEDLEDKVAEILAYLEKTKPEEAVA